MLSVQRSLSHLAGLLTSDQLALHTFPVSQWRRLQAIPFTAVGTFLDLHQIPDSPARAGTRQFELALNSVTFQVAMLGFRSRRISQIEWEISAASKIEPPVNALFVGTSLKIIQTQTGASTVSKR
jgi:hypothetical protein